MSAWGGGEEKGQDEDTNTTQRKQRTKPRTRRIINRRSFYLYVAKGWDRIQAVQEQQHAERTALWRAAMSRLRGKGRF